MRHELKAWLADKLVAWAFRLDPERFMETPNESMLRRLERIKLELVGTTAETGDAARLIDSLMREVGEGQP